jgi:hypothetical protein
MDATFSKRQRLASHLALMGGWIQMLAAASILFLPVLGDCWTQSGEMICGRRSYLQIGGNTLGYGLLLLMIAAGMIAIGSTRDSNRKRVLLSRWLPALISLIVMVITAWGFGLAFAPGGVLLLAASLWTRPYPDLI